MIWFISPFKMGSLQKKVMRCFIYIQSMTYLPTSGLLCVREKWNFLPSQEIVSKCCKCQGILAIWLMSGYFVITIEFSSKMIRLLLPYFWSSKNFSLALLSIHSCHSFSKWFIINIQYVYYCPHYLMSLHSTISANFSQSWLGLTLPKSLDQDLKISKA